VTAATCLIEQVRGLLERTYRMESGLGDLGRFVIGDAGYRRFYAGRSAVQVVGAGRRAPALGPAPGAESGAGASGDGARLLLRETAEGIRAAVYLPDHLVRTLERYPPQHGVGEENVREFATLVEETDHLLVVAERARLARPVSLFELELHANVSKYLVLSRFLAGREPLLRPYRRWWLWHQLFEGVEYSEDDADLQARYEEAGQWAARLIRALVDRRPRQRLELLREFHSATTAEKMALILDYRG
jgi:hypothetical protein